LKKSLQKAIDNFGDNDKRANTSNGDLVANLSDKQVETPVLGQRVPSSSFLVNLAPSEASPHEVRGNVVLQDIESKCIGNENVEMCLNVDEDIQKESGPQDSSQNEIGQWALPSRQLSVPARQSFDNRDVSKPIFPGISRFVCTNNTT
jgi:hypothetical protein